MEKKPVVKTKEIVVTVKKQHKPCKTSMKIADPNEEFGDFISAEPKEFTTISTIIRNNDAHEKIKNDHMLGHSVIITHEPKIEPTPTITEHRTKHVIGDYKVHKSEPKEESKEINKTCEPPSNDHLDVNKYEDDLLSIMSGKSISSIMPKNTTNAYKQALLQFLGTVQFKKEIIYAQIPKTEGFINLKIKVAKSWFASRYDIMVSGSEKVIANCAKKTSMSPYYVMNLESSAYNRKANEFLGKLRGGKEGEYMLYDSGLPPTKTKKKELIRIEHLAVLYQPIETSKKGNFKTMKVLMHNINQKVTKDPGSETLIKSYENKESDKLTIFCNKSASYDSKSKQHMLSNGGLSFPSLGGFILLDHTRNSSNFYILMSRKNDKEYSLMVKYPFSLFQAFGLAISTIVNKGCVI